LLLVEVFIYKQGCCYFLKNHIIMFKASVNCSRRAIAYYGGQKPVVVRRVQRFASTATDTVMMNNDSASSVVVAANFSNDANKEAEVDYSDSKHYPQRRRNKGIAEVIRAGWTSLNQTALDIQNSPVTRKPLFRSAIGGDIPDEEELVSPNIKAEEHRILSVALDCLHQIAQSQRDDEIAVFSVPFSTGNSRALHLSNAPVGGDGTMIVLLHVEIKKSNTREAILYWCLPYDILLDDTNYSSRQKQFLEFRVQQQLEQHGNKILQRHVHNVLRHYFPPKLRLEPATNDQLYDVLKKLSDW
jgi:hypothetical protein